MENSTEQGESSEHNVDTAPATTAETRQDTALIDQVFTMFKGYLTSQLEEKGNQLQNKTTIEKQATEFKYKGNRKQFEFNAELDKILSRILNSADQADKVRQLANEAKTTIKKRKKLIKIADKSKDGWLVVEEYESDDLASDTDHEKRLKKARSQAEKRRKESSRGNDQKKFRSEDNRFFRGHSDVGTKPQDRRCYRCHRNGHWARNCRAPWPVTYRPNRSGFAFASTSHDNRPGGTSTDGTSNTR